MSRPDPASSPVLQADVHPWFDLDKLAPHLFTPGRLRHLLRQRERNDLARHLMWIGRVAFIREAELQTWLDSQKTKP